MGGACTRPSSSLISQPTFVEGSDDAAPASIRLSSTQHVQLQLKEVSLPARAKSFSSASTPSTHVNPQPVAGTMPSRAGSTALKSVGVQTDDLAQEGDGSTTISMPSSWRKGCAIGSGSFGTVYLALNDDTGQLLAVKEVSSISAEGARGQESVSQLEHEVSVLSGLRHPNIVTYIGTMRQGATLLIFLEYMPGGSVSQLLSRFGPLAEPTIRCFTRQLLEGLAYLHATRTVHRDIKGANLLLSASGRVKLTDFGMAKQMVEAASFTQSFKGSAQFMAPEVIRQQAYGVSADVWSLGCTVLEMATGKPPWANCTTQVQVIFRIASTSEVPDIPESLTPQAAEFVLLCLQRDPSKRPTAEALLQHPWILAGQAPSASAAASPAGHHRHVPVPGARVTSGGVQTRPVASSSHPRSSGGAPPAPPPPPAGGGGGGGMQVGPRSHSFHRVSSNAQGVAGGSDASSAAGSTRKAAHQMSESEMTGVLADLVLGPVEARRAAARKLPRPADTHSSLTGQHPDGATTDQGATEGDGDELTFSTKPVSFKVQGLLTLPALKTLNDTSLHPHLHTQPLVMLPGAAALPSSIQAGQ